MSLAPTPNGSLAAQYLPGLFEPLAPSQASVLEYAETNYALRQRAKQNREAGLKILLSDIRMCDKWFRSMHGRELRFSDLCLALGEDFFAWHMSQPKVTSIETGNRSRTQLLTIWRDAARRNLCYPPPRELKKVKTDKRNPEAWREDEIDKILTAARDGDWRWERPRIGITAGATWSEPAVDASLWLLTIIWSLYDTGVRKSAFLTTPVANLDLRNRKIAIPCVVQKQRADQFFSLSPEVCGLWEQLDVHGRGLKRLGDDWPYDRHDNSRWKTLNRWYARLLREAGLVEEQESTRKHLWHKLRRTFATYVAVKLGVGEAQRQLGHSSPQVTARYIDQRFMPQVDATQALHKPRLSPPDVIPMRIAETG